MSNPHVRPVGDLEDHDGMTVIVGVDYETVTIHRGIFQPGGGIRFTAALLEEFTGLLAGARREALPDDGGDPEPLTDVPMVCTNCRRPVYRAWSASSSAWLWRHSWGPDVNLCAQTRDGEPVKAMVAAGNESVPR